MRGISEAISVILLIAVIATASFFAMNLASKRTETQEISVSEAIKKRGEQAQELVSIISKKKTSSSIIVELVNYGRDVIKINKVFVDASQTTYTLTDKRGNNLGDTIPIREIAELQTSRTGSAVQIVTSTGNLFEIVP